MLKSSKLQSNSHPENALNGMCTVDWLHFGIVSSCLLRTRQKTPNFPEIKRVSMKNEYENELNYLNRPFILDSLAEKTATTTTNNPGFIFLSLSLVAFY